MPKLLNRVIINPIYLLLILTLLAVTSVALITTKRVSAAACTPPATDYGSVTSTVSIPQSGSYRIWSRMLSPNATDNSYMLEVDGSSCFVVGDGSFNVNTWNNNATNWVDYQSGNTSSKINMTLSAGNHTIKMIGNAPGVMLDRVIFTSDTNCVPTGTGDNCANPPDTIAPTIAISAPANNASYTKGSTVTVNTTVSDDVGGSGIKKVDFIVDNGSPVSDETAPYQHSINTSNMSLGDHTIRATAYDVAGNSSSSTIITIKITAPPDTTAPTVSITDPANGSTKQGTISVTATASDNVGVSRVEFYVDGTKVGGNYTTAPYTMSLDTKQYANGSKKLTAKAYDAANNVAESAVVTININNPVTPPPDSAPPTVSITSPLNNTSQSGTVSIKANATDDIGVTKVDFQIDGQLAPNGSDTQAPFEYSLDTKTLSNGSHTLRAVAYDASGKSTPSSIITINVNNVSYIPEDINQDGKVNSLDFGTLVGVYGQSGPSIGRSDINKDGKVNSLDFGLLVAKYGYGT